MYIFKLMFWSLFVCCQFKPIHEDFPQLKPTKIAIKSKAWKMQLENILIRFYHYIMLFKNLSHLSEKNLKDKYVFYPTLAQVFFSLHINFWIRLLYFYWNFNIFIDISQFLGACFQGFKHKFCVPVVFLEKSQKFCLFQSKFWMKQMV